MGWGVVWASGVWTCWLEMGRHQRLPRRLSISEFYSNASQFVTLGRYIQLYPVRSVLLLVPSFSRYPLFFSNVEGGGPGGEAGPVECYVSWKSLLNTPPPLPFSITTAQSFLLYKSIQHPTNIQACVCAAVRVRRPGVLWRHNTRAKCPEWRGFAQWVDVEITGRIRHQKFKLSSDKPHKKRNVLCQPAARHVCDTCFKPSLKTVILLRRSAGRAEKKIFFFFFP